MLNFNFYSPTEVIFGRDTLKETGRLVKKYGGNRILLVYGTSSKTSGLIDEISALLKREGLSVSEYGGAMPNPTLDFVNGGIKCAIKNDVDFLLAVGGGSPIDAAKAIAHGTKNPETDVWQFWTREKILTKSLPIGVVLTIPAAGSETSASSVVTNTATGEKRGLNADFNRPRFAVMNPELTFTLPSFQRGCGIVDIMMHTMDRYFAPESGNEVTDSLAEALLRTVIAKSAAFMAGSNDYSAASEIMWAGSLSHNGLTGLGRTADFVVHQLGHELSGMFDVAHGASLSAMWGCWAKYSFNADVPRFARFAREVWGIVGDDLAAAQKGIESTVNFFASLNMPINFEGLGIGRLSEEQIEQLAHKCSFYGKRKVGVFFPLEKCDIINIYNLANNF